MRKAIPLVIVSALTAAVSMLSPVAADASELPPGAVEYVQIDYAEASSSDAELEGLLAEFGGTLAGCSATGEPSCAVSCFWGCCAIVCDDGQQAECYCSWGSPKCRCVDMLIEFVDIN